MLSAIGVGQSQLKSHADSTKSLPNCTASNERKKTDRFAYAVASVISFFFCVNCLKIQ